MKLKILLSGALVFFLVATSFTIHFPLITNEENTPNLQVKQEYIQGLEDFEKEIQRFHKIILQFDASGSVKELQKSFADLRHAYKKVEILMTYLDPEFVNDHINGAPLQFLEINAAGTSIMDPKGLQVIEEMVYDDEPEKHKKEIIENINLMIEHVDEFIPLQRQLILTDRHIFEASRMAMIQIFTLGITGFDTPSSGNSIRESLVSFQSVADMMAYYNQMPENEEGKVLVKQIGQRFEEGKAYLKQNADFDTFDRMNFLMKIVNPQFKDILALQKQLEIEISEETPPLKNGHPVNNNAENIFDQDFLNAAYYVGLPAYPDKHMIKLGNILFHDPILSGSNERSCASCHDSKKAFTDGEVKSIAADKKSTVLRNSTGLINSIYTDRFFYDLRAENLSTQIENVVTDQKEFHTSFPVIFEKLQKSEEYQQLFTDAFPDYNNQKIDQYTLTTAIAAYLISISDFDSGFDRYVRGESNNLSQDAIDGFNLFMGKAGCATCHFPPTFSGLVPPFFEEAESEVLGVPATPDTLNTYLDPDPGRADGIESEKSPLYMHSFKTTTVRNVSLTAPYMHNGVYETLEEVIDFYDRGGGAGLGFELENQTLPVDRLLLNAKEKKALVVFMESLTSLNIKDSSTNHLPRIEGERKLNKRRVGGTF